MKCDEYILYTIANKLVLAVEFSEGQRDFQELASSLIELVCSLHLENYLIE